MPASTLLLITIGILSVCVLFVHYLIRQHLHRTGSSVRSGARPHRSQRHEEWLIHSRTRDLTSASI